MPMTATSDRRCQTTYVCQASEYQIVAPTTTTDRYCQATYVCGFFEIEIIPVTSTSDRACTAAPVYLSSSDFAASHRMSLPWTNSTVDWPPLTSLSPYGTEFVAMSGVQAPSASISKVASCPYLPSYNLVLSAINGDLFLGNSVLSVSVLSATVLVVPLEVNISLILDACVSGVCSLSASCVLTAGAPFSIVNFNVPADWFAVFSINSTVLNTAPVPLSAHLHAITNSDPATIYASDDIVRFFAYAKVNMENAIAIEVPSYAVVPGSNFSLGVYGAAVNGLVSFSLTCESSNQSILVIDISAESGWTVSYVTSDSGFKLLAQSLSSPTAIPANFPASLALTIYASLSENVGFDAGLTCTVSELNDIYGTLGTSNSPVPIVCVDGVGNYRSDGVVPLIVGDDALIQLSAIIEKPTLINTATLTREEMIASSIVAYGLYSHSGWVKIDAIDGCGSSISGAVSFSSNCGYILFNGSESTAHTTDISISVGSIQSVGVSVSIWTLSSNISFEFDRTLVHSIATTNDCLPKFQDARLRLLANATNGDMTILYDASELLASAVRTSNSDIAVLRSVGVGAAFQLWISGVSAGQVEVVLVNNYGLNLVSETFTVSNTAVQVVALSLIVVSDVSLSVSGGCNGLAVTAKAGISFNLAREHQSSTATIYATFSDQTYRQISNYSFVALASSNESVLVTKNNGSYVVANTVSGSSVLTAQWGKGLQCNGLPITATKALLVNIVKPISGSVQLAHSRLAVQNSALLNFGLNAESRITVSLKFQDGSEADMTLDSRTIFDTGALGSLCSVSLNGTDALITANSQGLTGTGNLTVRFTHVGLVLSVSVVIVDVEKVQSKLTPWPMYNGSLNHTLSELRIIGDSGFAQKGVLSVVITTTDGLDLDVSTSDLTLAAWNSTLGETNIINIIRSAQTANFWVVSSSGSNPVYDSPLSIYASVGGIFANVWSLTLSNDSILITSLYNFSVPTTVRGISGEIGGQANVGVQFSDGTKIDNLFSSPTGGTYVDGLVYFTTDQPQIVDVNNGTGQLTVFGNSEADATISIISSLSSSASVHTLSAKIACNLNPGLNDIDIGPIDGQAYEPAISSEVFELAVRINVGDGTLGAIDLAINYETTELDFISIQQGADWTGTLVSARNDPEGQINFGGVPIVYRSGLLEIAVIQFKRMGQSSSSISGFVRTLVDQFGGITRSNETIIAGSIAVPQISGYNLTRREITVSTINRPNHGRRTAPGATACIHPAGDANLDCEFNIADALFVQQFVANVALGTNTVNLDGTQQNFLDADGNGAINLIDAVFLSRANFGLVRALTEVAISPPSDRYVNNCGFAISIQTASKFSRATDSNQTRIFIIVQASSSSLSAQYLASTPIIGKFSSDVSISSSSEVISSVVWEASNMGGGKFELLFDSHFTATELQFSIIQVTSDANRGSDASRVWVHNGATASNSHSIQVQFLNISGLSSSNVIKLFGFSPMVVIDQSVTTTLCESVVVPMFLTRFYFYADFNILIGTNTSNTTEFEQHVITGLTSAPLNIPRHEVLFVNISQGSIVTNAYVRSNSTANSIHQHVIDTNLTVYYFGGDYLAYPNPPLSSQSAASFGSWQIIIVIAGFLIILLVVILVVRKRRERWIVEEQKSRQRIKDLPVG